MKFNRKNRKRASTFSGLLLLAACGADDTDSEGLRREVASNAHITIQSGQTENSIEVASTLMTDDKGIRRFELGLSTIGDTQLCLLAQMMPVLTGRGNENVEIEQPKVKMGLGILCPEGVVGSANFILTESDITQRYPDARRIWDPIPEVVPGTDPQHVDILTQTLLEFDPEQVDFTLELELVNAQGQRIFEDTAGTIIRIAYT